MHARKHARTCGAMSVVLDKQPHTCNRKCVATRAVCVAVCGAVFVGYRCGAMFVEPPGEVLQGLNAKARDALHHAQYQVYKADI